SSEVVLNGLDMDDCQGDKKIIEALISMGAAIEIDCKNKQLKIKSTPSLQGAELDINDYIDAIAILAVIGCYAKGKTHLFNAKIARRKESDRISTIAMELKKMGARIEELEEGLIIHHSPLHGAHLTSHSDHRIAMALSVAALGASSCSTIDNVECICKTYPTFASDFAALGGQIEVMP
ncbi:MAG: 3-phosphoshikimate 1-carboxyvinyltransferase, partial [Chlamydiales bacterium]|nr:3-phosphoshikimate 1-carboxyvinyltransferase [Chlamydiales bacterium]